MSRRIPNRVFSIPNESNETNDEGSRSSFSRSFNAVNRQFGENTQARGFMFSDIESVDSEIDSVAEFIDPETVDEHYTQERLEAEKLQLELEHASKLARAVSQAEQRVHGSIDPLVEQLAQKVELFSGELIKAKAARARWTTQRRDLERLVDDLQFKLQEAIDRLDAARLAGGVGLGSSLSGGIAARGGGGILAGQGLSGGGPLGRAKIGGGAGLGQVLPMAFDGSLMGGDTNQGDSIKQFRASLIKSLRSRAIVARGDSNDSGSGGKSSDDKNNNYEAHDSNSCLSIMRDAAGSAWISLLLFSRWAAHMVDFGQLPVLQVIYTRSSGAVPELFKFLAGLVNLTTWTAILFTFLIVLHLTGKPWYNSSINSHICLGTSGFPCWIFYGGFPSTVTIEFVYLTTILASCIGSFIVALRLWLRFDGTFQVHKLQTDMEGKKRFANVVLIPWAYGTLTSESDVHNYRIRYTRLLASMRDEIDAARAQELLTKSERYGLAIRRATGFLINILMIAAGWVIIFGANRYQGTIASLLSNVSVLSSIATIVPSLIVSVVGIVMRPLINIITGLEGWNAQDRSKQQIWRLYLSNMANVCIFAVLNFELLADLALFGTSSSIINFESAKYTCREDQAAANLAILVLTDLGSTVAVFVVSALLWPWIKSFGEKPRSRVADIDIADLAPDEEDQRVSTTDGHSGSKDQGRSSVKAVREGTSAVEESGDSTKPVFDVPSNVVDMTYSLGIIMISWCLCPYMVLISPVILVARTFMTISNMRLCQPPTGSSISKSMEIGALIMQLMTITCSIYLAFTFAVFCIQAIPHSTSCGPFANNVQAIVSVISIPSSWLTYQTFTFFIVTVFMTALAVFKDNVGAALRIGISHTADRASRVIDSLNRESNKLRTQNQGLRDRLKKFNSRAANDDGAISS